MELKLIEGIDFLKASSNVWKTMIVPGDPVLQISGNPSIILIKEPGPCGTSL